jgi:L-rhamnose-H+ transport protein
MIAGIALAGWAGHKRESGVSQPKALHSSYRLAIALAILCGLLAPMLNYAFAFGEKIGDEAVLFGNSHEAAGYAVWPVALLGGFFPNVGYALFLLWKRRTWTTLRASWFPDAWWGFAMGALWMGAFAIYGVSSVYLGALGTSAGWALFQIFMIITANGSGLITSEWKGAPASARYGIAGSLVLLALATALIAPRN